MPCYYMASNACRLKARPGQEKRPARQGGEALFLEAVGNNRYRKYSSHLKTWSRSRNRHIRCIQGLYVFLAQFTGCQVPQVLQVPLLGSLLQLLGTPQSPPDMQTKTGAILAPVTHLYNP